MTAPTRFTHGLVLEDKGLEDRSLTISDGQIADGTGREVDLSGFWVLPGVVDTHGDGFEGHLAPRRGALRDLRQGLFGLEAELAANGITTATLAQFWSWEGGMRGPEFARRLCVALGGYEATLDLHLQLRLEIGCHEDFPAIEALIAKHRIGYVVFNDHLPHDRLAAGKRPPRLEGQALKSGRAPAEHHALLQRLHDQIDTARGKLPGLAERLMAAGVRLGSHDDATEAARRAWCEMGARIAEFPMTAEAAQAARDVGDPMVMGAPNVLRSGSHSKGISAAEEIAKGGVTALASDYHYPAPWLAAFRLADDGLPLPQAWALVSDGPARLLGFTDRGRIAPGLRADLVIVETETRRIAGTMAGGRFVHIGPDLAERILAA